MAKFLLGVAIIAFTSFCGYLLTKKYRRRKQFFSQLFEFNERFLAEITYYRRPLRAFVSAYTYRGEFQELLLDYFAETSNQGHVFIERIDNSEYDFLKKEEKRTVYDYFSMLGKGDSNSQKNYFTSVKETLSKLKKEAEENNKKYGDLYVKLGFLCGLLILILVI